MMLNQMTGNNPMVSTLMKSMQGKSPDALRQMAMNIAKERGIDLDQFAQQFGMDIKVNTRTGDEPSFDFL